MHGSQRGDAYYTSAIDGSKMAALPKIRVGQEKGGWVLERTGDGF